jgi:hypothetical protein
MPVSVWPPMARIVTKTDLPTSCVAVVHDCQTLDDLPLGLPVEYEVHRPDLIG